MLFYIALVLAAASLNCSAFTHVRVSSIHRVVPKNLPREDTALSVGSFPAFVWPPKKTRSAVPVNELKQGIIELAKGTSNGISASEDTRVKIQALVMSLEKSNKEKLTKSPLIDGSWTLTYTTNEGSSAGKIGPFVGTVIQDIDQSAGQYFNIVRIGGGLFEGALTASWDVLPGNRWRVKFESIAFKLLGVTVTEKPLVAQGTWRLTYLDENFRVLYAMGGKNLAKENIYILTK
jgi:hypothetical protein